MNNPESESKTKEILNQAGEKAAEFKSKADQIKEAARANLPDEIKEVIGPGRLAAEGIGKIVVGSGVDIAGGIMAALASGGFSEIIPLEDYIVDEAVGYAVGKLSNRELRSSSKWIARSVNWIPVVSDFVNPTTIDGFRDVWDASRAFYKGAKEVRQDGADKNPL